MYTVTKDPNPRAAKPWLVMGKNSQVAGRFTSEYMAKRKAAQLNYRRGA